jgi:hypothetical protein
LMWEHIWAVRERMLRLVDSLGTEARHAPDTQIV